MKGICAKTLTPSCHILVIVEAYKNTPPLNEDSVLFSQNRNSVGKVSSTYISSLKNLSVLCLTEPICCPSGFWSFWTRLSTLLRYEVQLEWWYHQERTQNSRPCLLCPQNKRFHRLHLHRETERVSASSEWCAYSVGLNTHWNSEYPQHCCCIFPQTFTPFPFKLASKDQMHPGKMTRNLLLRWMWLVWKMRSPSA